MAARTSMAGLITLVRGLINDPVGSSQQYTDEAIEDQLDHDVKAAMSGLLSPERLPVEALSITTGGGTW